MDYNQLVASSTTAGSIANWVLHTAAQAAAPSIIQEAESAIYRRLRHWKMVTSTIGTMGSSSASLTLPADYLEDKSFRFTGIYNARIPRKTMQEVLSNYAYDGSGNRAQSTPQMFFNDQSSLVFDAPAYTALPFQLYYFQQPIALSTANTSNFLTALYPRLMRCACMTAASEYMKDAGMGNYDRTYWAQMTEDEIYKAQVESDLGESSIEAGMMLA